MGFRFHYLEACCACVSDYNIHIAVQRFLDWIFNRFPTNATYRAAIELRSWNRFSQDCKLTLA